MVRIGSFWILLAGTYLAFVGSLSLAEAGAALLCGGLGAVWTWQLARCGDRHLHVPVAGLGKLGSAFLKLPGETASVATRLLRAALRGDVSGEDRAVAPSDAAHCPLSGDDPETAYARAVSVLAASLAPDSYVLRLEPERGRVLVHTILPGDAR